MIQFILGLTFGAAAGFFLAAILSATNDDDAARGHPA